MGAAVKIFSVALCIQIITVAMILGHFVFSPKSRWGQVLRACCSNKLVQTFKVRRSGRIPPGAQVFSAALFSRSAVTHIRPESKHGEKAVVVGRPQGALRALRCSWFDKLTMTKPALSLSKGAVRNPAPPAHRKFPENRWTVWATGP